MNKVTKILMCSSPQSGRGPGNAFANHFKAIKNTSKFDIDLLTQEHLTDLRQLSLYDIFWFSIRFHPQIYYFLKHHFPDKTYVMGPNVLFEKAEIGPSDEWEKWFVENVQCNYYFNKAEFYLDRAKEFFHGSKNYNVLANCLDLDNIKSLYNEKVDSDKVLVYSKKRRIDKQFDEIFPKFIDRLNKENIKYEIIEYGKYHRDDLIKNAPKFKACFWFSIEDFCSNAQLEIQATGTPIIGTKHNLTHTFDKNYITNNGSILNESWIRWNENISDLYFETFKKYESEFNNKQLIKNRIEYIEKYHSYNGYIDQLSEIFK